MWQTPIGRRKAAQPSPMKRPKISEAISPLTKSRHPAKTPPRHCSARGHRDKTRSLYRARPQVRERVFQRIVASILNYRGSNAPASFILSAEFLPGLHPVLIQALSSSHSHSNDDKRSLDQSGLGTRLGAAQGDFDFAPHLLDGIEVRQEEDLAFMRREIVHYDHVALAKGRERTQRT
jgi:hypothetical protein